MKRLLGVVLAAMTAVSAVAVSPPAVPGELIVRLKPGVDPAELKAEPLVPEIDLYLVRTPLPPDALVRSGLVEYAHPNHVVTLRATPNDPLLPQQWNMPAVKAADAWDYATGGRDKLGNEIVVAVVDGGLATGHADLVDNLWVNPGEIAGNGIDDDGNGYVDDVHGWNVFSNSGKLSDDDHGTHVAGIIGAKGNNNDAVAGVNWDVKVMGVEGASGSTATVAKAYGYVIKQKRLWLDTKGAQGANIVATNSSFGVDFADCTSAQYKAWNDLYDEMGRLGILSAAATANLNIDIDVRGDVPTGCDSPYLISVTNTNRDDKKYASAGYGKKHVDLGAPGTAVLSTLSRGTGTLTGTSMATPHVAGAVALMHAAACERFALGYQADPAKAALELKDVLLKNVDPLPDLQNVTVSGGRLNLHKAAERMFSTCGLP